MEHPRRLWTAVIAAAVAGISAVVVGLLMTRPGVGISCEAAHHYKTCTSRVVGEELVYTGFALVAFALLTAVAALGRSEPHR